MKRIALAASVAATLATGIAGTAAAQTFDFSKTWDGTPEDLAAIRTAVADKLRDPPSAYFRDVEVRQMNGDKPVKVICGKVSGRNGFGGLGQPMLFYFLNEPTLLPEPVRSGERATVLADLSVQMWSLVCVTGSTPIEAVDWNAAN